MRIACLLLLPAADSALRPVLEDERPVAVRLAGQVAGLGHDRLVVLCDPSHGEMIREHLPTADVTVVASPGEALVALAGLADEARVLDVLDGALYGHRGVLEQALLPPGDGALALLAPPGQGAIPVRVRDGRIEEVGPPGSAGEPSNRPPALLPVLHVGSAAMAGLREALPRLRDAPGGGADAGAAPAWETAGRDADGMVALLTRSLVSVGEPVGTVPLGDFVLARPADEAALDVARARTEAVDEERVRLARAVKDRDGFFTTFLVSPYSRYLARWCARHGWSPDQVTILSLLVGLAAAGAFAWGTLPALVAGAVLLQAAFTLDCVDGQLARYARSFSARGAWLDSVFDRTKEYVVYAGLAVGAVRTGDDGAVWWLAGGALAFQALRHHLDFAFTVHREAFEAPPAPRPLDAPWWRPGQGSPSGDGPGGSRGLLGAARRLGDVPGLHWFKAIVILPIGERFAVISLGAVLLGPRATFGVLLVWGAVAAVYLGTGRLLRSRAWASPTVARPTRAGGA